jgi:ribosomal-protein-alanine N-acetyltransferase
VSPLEIAGPVLRLRYPTAGDASALFELGRDPEVTRFFSWGPYAREEEAAAFIAALPQRRESGQFLEFLVVHAEDGPIGITGLSELSRRDRRAVVGTWFARSHWGTGVNAESKALILHLAFEVLGLERVSAYASVENARSQVALERLGFHREGVLAEWHRHSDRVHDLALHRFLRSDWERSQLADVPVEVRGEPPPAWRADLAPR